MSIINEGSSDSLVIAEGKNDFQINSSEEKPKIEDDIFELSNDQVSLSFKIQEEQKMRVVRQLARQSQQDTLVLNVVEPLQQQNRKKRKEIFERGRRPQKSILNKIQASKGQDNLLNIFDSIFNTKARDSGPLCGGQVNYAQIKANSGQLLEAISIRSKTPSAQKRQRVKIFGKKAAFKGVLPPDILQDSINGIQKSEINPPSMKENEKLNKPAVKQTQSRVFGVQSPIKNNSIDESVNFFNMEKRISGIEFEEQEFSRDTLEINNILESQIFQQQPKQITVQKQIRRVQRVQTRIQPVQERKVVQTTQPKHTSPDFSKKTSHKIQLTQPISQESEKKILIMVRSDQKEVSPVKKIENISLLGQQIEESRYLVNEVSSVSSAPELINHFYNNNGFAPQNSTVNVKDHNFGDVSSLRHVETIIKRGGLNSSNLFQSQVVQVHERININNLYEQESRLPIFLRKIRHQISIFPNFYLMIRNPHTTESIEKDFNQLFNLFREGIIFLSNLCQKVLDIKSKMQLYMQQLITNLSLEFFLESGWEKISNFEDYELIAPVQPIQLRAWSYQKAKTALANYENITNYYSSKGIRIDTTTEVGQKKYFQIRQKFWDICGNLKLISEDIFLEMRNCMFPKHYYEFLQYMKSGPLDQINEQKIQNVRHLLNIYRYHLQKNDILLNSEIGLKIKKKLELQLRYLVPF